MVRVSLFPQVQGVRLPATVEPAKSKTLDSFNDAKPTTGTSGEQRRKSFPTTSLTGFTAPDSQVAVPGKHTPRLCQGVPLATRPRRSKVTIRNRG